MQDAIELLQSAEAVQDGSSRQFSPSSPLPLPWNGFDLEPIPIGPNGIERVVPQALVSSLKWTDDGLKKNLAEIFSRRVSYNTFEAPLLPEADVLGDTLSDDSDRSQIQMAPFELYQPATTTSAIPLVNHPHVVPSSIEDKLDLKRYRGYQAGQWNERFQELMQFRKEYGHLFVPHSYPLNQKLAQWVKRQRYQYKLKLDGKHSTLSDKREEMLTNVGFIWGSHAACWQEHFQALEAFYLAHGHCSVPADYTEDPSLTVWMKHQRRNYKLYMSGKPSTMTKERLRCLQSIRFEWTPRSGKKKSV